MTANKIAYSGGNTIASIDNAVSADGLKLILHIHDPLVASYLEKFPENVRPEKALEALKVGIIALQSASPTLDTRVVEETFSMVQQQIHSIVEGVRSEFQQHLQTHFAPQGTVNTTLDKMLGKNGQLEAILNNYFTNGEGKLSQLLQYHVGAGSSFANAIDPNNTNSVIAQLRQTIQTTLLQEIQKELRNVQEGMSEQFVKLSGTIQNTLGTKSGKEEESKKGTAKGGEFEDVLFERFAVIASGLHDIAEQVGGKPGKGVPGKPNAKTGDYVVELGEASGAPHQRIVVEVKDDKSYTLRKALDELKEAKFNREASVGIFIFEKDAAPPELGEFYLSGNDFVVTVSKEALEQDEAEALFFVQAAYTIARRMLAQSAQMKISQEIDVEAIRRELQPIEQLSEQITDIRTKSKTLRNTAEAIDKTTDNIEKTLKAAVENMLKLIA